MTDTKKFGTFFIAWTLLYSSFGFCTEVTIIQKDKKFSTEAVSIKVGDTLIFKNEETSITHNVYSITPDNEFELKTQKPGTSSPVLISGKNHRPGEMLVECAIHPNMKLKVTITN